MLSVGKKKERKKIDEHEPNNIHTKVFCLHPVLSCCMRYTRIVLMHRLAGWSVNWIYNIQIHFTYRYSEVFSFLLFRIRRSFHFDAKVFIFAVFFRKKEEEDEHRTNINIDAKRFKYNNNNRIKWEWRIYSRYQITTYKPAQYSILMNRQIYY